jgi:hypothetical protein
MNSISMVPSEIFYVTEDSKKAPEGTGHLSLRCTASRLDLIL